MKRVFGVLVVAVAAMAMVMPAAASAMVTSITSTQVVTPANNTQRFVDRLPGAPAPSITVSGTAVGQSASDTVDLYCVYISGASQFNKYKFATALATNDVTGAWSYTGDPTSIDRLSCLIVAVPTPLAINAVGDLTNWHGHLLYSSSRTVDVISSGINTGKPFDYGYGGGRIGGYNDVYSFSDCGLCTSALIFLDGGIPHVSTYLWYYDNSYSSEAGTPLGTTNRGLLVDGYTTFDAYAASNMNTGATPGMNMTGFPTASFSVPKPDAKGNVKITENQQLVRCNADNHVVSPGATCTKWISTGVALKRTVTISKSGVRVAFHDGFRSLDGAKHAVKLQVYESNSFDSSLTAPMLWFPWLSGGFQMRANGATFTPAPKRSWAMYATPSASGPSQTAPAGSIVVSDKASALQMQPTGHDEWLHLHSFTVPAKGVYTRDQGYSMSASLAGAKTGTAYFRDLYTAPVIFGVKPRNRARVSGMSVVLRGRVVDVNGAVTKVTVNGRKVRVRRGKFAASLTLRSGSNMIKIKAFDAAGNVTLKHMTLRAA